MAGQRFLVPYVRVRLLPPQPFFRAHDCMAWSSSGLGHRPLKAKIGGSNPLQATIAYFCEPFDAVYQFGGFAFLSRNLSRTFRCLFWLAEFFFPSESLLLLSMVLFVLPAAKPASEGSLAGKISSEASLSCFFPPKALPFYHRNLLRFFPFSSKNLFANHTHFGRNLPETTP